MKNLLLAVTAAVALLIALSTPASAHVSGGHGGQGQARSSIFSTAGGDDEHGEGTASDDDGTDPLTFAGLFVGGVAFTLAMAALVRAGRRIPQ